MTKMKEQEKLNRYIFNLFRRLNFDSSLAGYQYMKYAVQMCMEDKSKICNIWKMYGEIGNIPHVSKNAGCVERCIRHLAKRTVETNENAGNKLLYEIFGDVILTEKRITNKRFVSQIVEYLECEMAE